MDLGYPGIISLSLYIYITRSRQVKVSEDDIQDMYRLALPPTKS